MVRATAESTSSPARWPYLSLTDLKWSTSIIKIARWSSLAAARSTSRLATSRQYCGFATSVSRSVRTACRSPLNNWC